LTGRQRGLSSRLLVVPSRQAGRHCTVEQLHCTGWLTVGCGAVIAVSQSSCPFTQAGQAFCSC
jgi:hypothetical protein